MPHVANVIIQQQKILIMLEMICFKKRCINDQSLLAGCMNGGGWPSQGCSVQDSYTLCVAAVLSGGANALRPHGSPPVMSPQSSTLPFPNAGKKRHQHSLL